MPQWQRRYDVFVSWKPPEKWCRNISHYNTKTGVETEKSCGKIWKLITGDRDAALPILRRLWSFFNGDKHQPLGVYQHWGF